VAEGLLDYVESDEQYRLFRLYWSVLRTRLEVDSMNYREYHFRLEGGVPDVQQIVGLLRGVWAQQTHPIRINLSFGTILQHNTDRTHYSYSFAGTNSLFFDQAKLVSSSQDLQTRLINHISREDIVEQIKTRVNSVSGSSWDVAIITDVVMYVAILSHYSGAGAPVRLPDYIWRNRALVSLARNHMNHSYDDDLCLFRCLALYSGFCLADVEEPAREMFQQWCDAREIDPTTFHGITMEEVSEVEDLFDVNIDVYEMSTWFEDELRAQAKWRHQNENYTVDADDEILDSDDENDRLSTHSSVIEDVMDLVAQPTYTENDLRLQAEAELHPHATLVLKSRGIKPGGTVNVNIYDGVHFSYIKNMALYCKAFVCVHCDKLFHTAQHFKRHAARCNVGIREIYPGGGWGRKPDLFEELADVCGEFVPKEKQFYPFVATFDFEARFKRLDDIAMPPQHRANEAGNFQSEEDALGQFCIIIRW
jgi:hypothetical protein